MAGWPAAICGNNLNIGGFLQTIESRFAKLCKLMVIITCVDLLLLILVTVTMTKFHGSIAGSEKETGRITPVLSLSSSYPVMAISPLIHFWLLIEKESEGEWEI